MKSKWILLAAATIMIAISLLRADFSVYRQLSPADLLPVVAIVTISFVLKTGIVSTLLIGIKKLWERISRK